MKRSRRTSRTGLAMFRGSVRNSRAPLSKAVWIVAASVFVLFVIVVVWSIQRRDALRSWQESLEADTVVAWPDWDPKWPLLPRPREATAAIDLRGPYAFTARNAIFDMSRAIADVPATGIAVSSSVSSAVSLPREYPSGLTTRSRVRSA